MWKWKNGVSVGMNECVKDEELNGKTSAECMRLLDERLNDEWQNRWHECENGRVTYEFIKNVRFAWMNEYFDPGMYALFIITGHGSMNGFLYQRGLCESSLCACGVANEDWKHVLCDCCIYDDIRDLGSCGVIVRENGSIDVSSVLGDKATYECFCETVRRMFERRMTVVRLNAY